MAAVESLTGSREAIDGLRNVGYQYAPYRTDVIHWFCKPGRSGNFGTGGMEYPNPGVRIPSFGEQGRFSGAQSGVTLTVGREAVVDFTLQVSTIAETVTVTGEAPLVQTANATVAAL